MDPVREESLGLQARHLAAIVDSSDDAIISKDLNGTILSWNRSAERIFGYTASEMIGQSIRKIIPADRQSEEDEVVARLRRGQKVDHFETIRQHKDGHLLPISLTVSPIHDERGLVVGASKIARDISERKEAEAERSRLLALAQLNAAITNTLNDVGAAVASALDREQVVQKVTDAATSLTGARFGAFFYKVVDERDESFTLCAVSGVPRDAFADFPTRNTEAFNPMFRGAEVVRSDDITADPPDRQNALHYGMPTDHLPVRSYLAVPVKTRSGEPLGGLFFGHPDVARFTAEHERLVKGIASWASVALENARLYRAAQDANSLKDEFLATLSHELRTPLNAILGYARMLRSGILTSNKWPRAVDIIERNAASLSRIVEDVLDISRIVSGKMRLSVTPVDLTKLVRDAIDSVQPGATAKGIDIDSILDKGTGSVPGDAERLQQVVWNILSNALKFTERGGRITVTLARHGGNVQLRVSDTGIGMAPEFLPHIFERFRQADAGTTRERGGLGLGLSIARQLVEMHGGTIVASSGGRGAGSTFTMTLPISAPAVTAADAERPTHPRTERTVIPDLRGTLVLAVDDDEDALTMVRDILEASGASVLTVRSAGDALRTLAQSPPDVLIADLGMPEMDGFELIRKVRAHMDPKISQVPAAALTAFARSEDRARALEIGFDRHLAKPIDPEALMAAVAQLRGKVRLARTL